MIIRIGDEIRSKRSERLAAFLALFSLFFLYSETSVFSTVQRFSDGPDSTVNDHLFWDASNLEERVSMQIRKVGIIGNPPLEATPCPHVIGNTNQAAHRSMKEILLISFRNETGGKSTKACFKDR